MTNRETRVLKAEVRAVEAEGVKKLAGTAIVYERESDDIGFIEVIKRGAATEALKRSDIRALYGHNSDSLLPLGRMSAGTLRAKETEAGVEIEVDPPDTQFARDLTHAIERGDIREMSFAFTVKDDEWGTRDGKHYREIREFDELFDVSFVAFPAYPDTTAALRKRDSVALCNVDAEAEDIDIALLINRTGGWR